MSTLQDYTADEQARLLEGLMLGAVVVAAASLGRSTETVAEGFAAADLVTHSRGDYLANPLVSALLFELERRTTAGEHFADFRKLAEAPGAKETSLAKLRQVAELLAHKADPAEAAGYKELVRKAAVRASEAGQEGGGFLGRGAVLVNDAERAALAEIAAALGSE